ncbi:hypothetical protein OSB04_000689 [Centaurea solstitialis]|uniref:F-box domain-containing protein n=1 Tax=Centaurea solstitialis TaxID=347529 RepID=A0AA38TX17_9ASTR|nr:hypothetical protein OSB04_000689 [Centaurea solstitialis]
MTENHTGRFLTCVEMDRMSNLPRHLIGLILERLPVQDAVRTSILSKNWRYIWTTMTRLVFDRKFSENIVKVGAFGRNGFIRIINDVLNHHNGPILKFSLLIPRIDLDSFREVDQTMLLLSRKSVKELALTNLNPGYEVPSYVSSCSELRKLELENFIFNPPLKFEVFSNLEDLILINIDFGANSCGAMVTLPQLRRLELVTCKNVYNFNIMASQLQALLVFGCHDAMLLKLLDAPHLNKYLSADEIPKWLPRAVNSLSNLELEILHLSDLDQLHGALCLLRNSPNLERLYMRQSPRKEPWVTRYDVQAASDHLESQDCLHQTFNRLQTVEIEFFDGSRPALLFIKVLLARSPSLEKLTIHPSRTSSNAHESLNIVMQFAQVSPKAKVIFL